MANGIACGFFNKLNRRKIVPCMGQPQDERAKAGVEFKFGFNFATFSAFSAYSLNIAQRYACVCNRM